MGKSLQPILPEITHTLQYCTWFWQSSSLKWHTRQAVSVHAMKANAKVEVHLHSFLISVLDGAEGSALPQPLYPWGSSNLYPLKGGWMGTGASQDVVVKGKICCWHKKSTHNSSVAQPVACSLYCLYCSTTLTYCMYLVNTSHTSGNGQYYTCNPPIFKSVYSIFYCWESCGLDPQYTEVQNILFLFILNF